MNNGVWGVRLSQSEHQFLENLSQQTDGLLTKAGVLRLLIRHGQATKWEPLTGGTTVAAYSVGAAPRPPVPPKKPSTENDPERPAPSSQTGEDTKASTDQATKPKQKREKFSPLVPSSELEKFSDAIFEFWRVKKGAKSKDAWGRLIKEISKIQAKYGDAVVAEQLDAGIQAGTWASITLKNYERFKPRAAASEPEHRHPASQVFTVKDFEPKPTADNPLSDLF